VTNDDLARIEQALGIRLPAGYRRIMAAYPIAAAAGNTDLDVWDDADRLIEYNKRLRGGAHPWPDSLFAIGHAGDGSPRALDLRTDEGAVWWMDHANVDSPTSEKESDSFESWAADYFAALREEMSGEEVDPDASPSRRAEVEEVNMRGATIGCVVAPLAIVVVILLIKWLVMRWT
jgi:hypothetical protein